MSYVSFRGVRTDDLGLYIAKGGMIAHKKGKLRHIAYDIPGRDGAVHVIDGYSPFDLKLMLQMVDANAQMRQIVNAWADGTGDLYTSDNTTRVWKASVLKEVKYTRTCYHGKMYDQAEITFRCQPVMRERTPSVVTLTGAGKLTNIGNVEAQPKIVVKGSGDCTVTVGETSISLAGVTGEVTIDTETGYVYSASGAVGMNGEFPTLGLGDTPVSFGGGVTSLEITPNWGWI